MTSDDAAPDPHARRKPLGRNLGRLGIAGACLVILLTGLVMAWWPDGDENPPPPDDTSDDGVTAEALDVSETGYSTEELSDGKVRVSMGAVLRNPTDKPVAFYAGFELLDQDSRPLHGAPKPRGGLHNGVYLPPDSRTAFGDVVTVDDGRAADRLDGVGVTVTGASGDNLRVDDTVTDPAIEAEPDGSIATTATDIDADEFDPFGLVEFDAENTYQKPVNRTGFGIVFRDRDGGIVGGWHGVPIEQDPETGDEIPDGIETGDLEYPVGHSTHEVAAMVPAGAESAETELSVWPVHGYRASPGNGLVRSVDAQTLPLKRSTWCGESATFDRLRNVMSVRQPQTPGNKDDADSYPDPKRSWGRSGSLLATWLVLLVGIYFTGWIFDAVVDKTAESSTDQAPETSSSAAWQFLSFVYNEGKVDEAEGLACDDTSGLTAQNLHDELSDWEEKSEALADTTVTVEDKPSSGANVYLGLVELDAESTYLKWYFDVTVQADGNSYCVADVKKSSAPDSD